MYFLLCSHEMCLLLNCVAEARDLSPRVKKTSVLSRPKEGGRSKFVVLDFVVLMTLLLW